MWRKMIPALALVAAMWACAWGGPAAPGGATGTPAGAAMTAAPSNTPAAAATAATARPGKRPTPAAASPTPPGATQPSATPAGPVATLPTPTYPAPNPAYPLIMVELQAVQVADNDGQQAARITPAQVNQWVDKANAIYAKASIRLVFDPAADFATLKSTTLNDMAGDTDTNWNREVEAGNRAAAGYSGKLLVLFIHGPGPGATGGGFSSADYNFVEMPGFNDTQVCGYQNLGILAHEVGHYFGLAHPFTQVFTSLAQAELYLSAHGNDPHAFDGDGLRERFLNHLEANLSIRRMLAT